MRVIVSLVFLMLLWYSQYFLYVLNEKFLYSGLFTSVPQFHPRVVRPPPFKSCPPLLSSPIKNPQTLFALQFAEKNTIKGIVYETSKVNIPNLLRG